MLRIEDTEDDVDFRPLKPLGRRKVDRGVSGDGEIECLLLLVGVV